MELVGSANNQSYNSFIVHALNFEMVEDLDYFVTHSTAIDLPNDDFNESNVHLSRVGIQSVM